MKEENLPALQIPHGPVMLVLDTSHSMWGRGMQDQQDALRAFHKALCALEFSDSRIEIAAVGMGDDLRVLQPFKPLAESTIGTLPIRPKGGTPIGGALRLALDELRRWTETLRMRGEGVATPQLLILSDGKSSDDFTAEADEIRRKTAEGSLCCRAIATGDTPDLVALSRIAGTCVDQPDYGRLREMFAKIGEKVSQTYEDAVPSILMAETSPEPGGIGVEVPANTVGKLAGRTILVDGTNVCFWGRNGATASLAPILALARALDAAGADWQACFDASTRHHLAKSGTGDETEYEALLRSRPDHFVEAPGGTCADEFLLSAASAEQTAVIISNDFYRDHEADYPFVKDKSRFIRGGVFRDQLCIPHLGIRCALARTDGAVDAEIIREAEKKRTSSGNSGVGFLI